MLSIIPNVSGRNVYANLETAELNREENNIILFGIIFAIEPKERYDWIVLKNETTLSIAGIMEIFCAKDLNILNTLIADNLSIIDCERLLINRYSFVIDKFSVIN